MIETFVIQSDTTSLSVVEERLFHFCNECHVGNYYSALAVATLQATENAIKHGNHSQHQLTVSLTFGQCRGGIFVEVADQGAGFDHNRYTNLPDEGQQGVGIFVMRQLSDKLEFLDGGRRVRMEFAVAGIDTSIMLERIALLHERMATVAA